jgi:hypothetical protein
MTLNFPYTNFNAVQVIGYAARAVSHFHTTSTTLYAIQTLLILLAPTLYAASIYMVLGRVITFLHGDRLSYVPVRYMTKIFVFGDALSFILQGAGEYENIKLPFILFCYIILTIIFLRWWCYE